MSEVYHVPVLLNESIEGLNINPNGIYIDVTFGGGGHSRAILEKLDKGRLIAFDQDSDALRNCIDDERFLFVHHNFRYLKNFLRYYEIGKVDGILADLGVSSHDFDVAERGFSFRFEGDLDMRMNQNSSFSASNIINEYNEEKLAEIFKLYGELSNARKLASIIVKERSIKMITTTSQLMKCLEPLVPKAIASKFMAQVFQSLRIEVNRELEVLKDFLKDTVDVLKPGGRLVVISYHSLEDRLVKNFIQKGDFTGEAEKDFFGNLSLQFKAVNRKVIVPNDEEIKRNSRSRSAKLRVAERI